MIQTALQLLYNADGGTSVSLWPAGAYVAENGGGWWWQFVILHGVHACWAHMMDAYAMDTQRESFKTPTLCGISKPCVVFHHNWRLFLPRRKYKSMWLCPAQSKTNSLNQRRRNDHFQQWTRLFVTLYAVTCFAAKEACQANLSGKPVVFNPS